MKPTVTEVTEATFAAEVLARSNEIPVVVDFWAPWCAPCRTLGPILEDLAARANGAWVLVKVNSDDAPQLAQNYGVRGIPAVKAFVEGRVLEEFVGALPRVEVESFLRTVVAFGADAIGLRKAREALASGDRNGLRAHLAAIGADSPHAETAASALALLDRAAGNVGRRDLEALRSRAADPGARFDLGTALFAAGDGGGALAEFLEVVRLDRKFEDDAGRRALLALFALLGNDHDLTREYRGKLGALLF